MAVSYRQSKRIWRRYRAQGDAGLVHRLRGQPSARRKPAAFRAPVLARYAEERYADFGPTLMAEQLAKEGLVVDHQTYGGGGWRKASGRYADADKSTGNGESESRVLGRWCNWTARTTIGLRDGESPAY